ncbi:hypothetical protein [Pedobacter terrae]|uniref:hypothetical protein n=1 Tax=Pedobacter terrae TaxID=405671 RepID=UPI002FF44AF3
MDHYYSKKEYLSFRYFPVDKREIDISSSVSVTFVKPFPSPYCKIHLSGKTLGQLKPKEVYIDDDYPDVRIFLSKIYFALTEL